MSLLTAARAARAEARSTPVAATLRLVGGGAVATAKTRLHTSGPGFYALVWLGFPVFNLLIIALIYRNNASLRDYAVVGGAAMAMLFGMQFNAAEILDNERQRGTLGNLFLSPAPRHVWLGGFQLFSTCESIVTAALTVGVGVAVFGLSTHINAASLAVTLVLFVACMWGFSMAIGALGLAIRDANQLSNLLFPFIQILAGTMFPIALMPTWVAIPAHLLPFQYAVQAMVASVTEDASIGQLGPDLGPLFGFACLLPIAGVVAFRLVERRTRRRGALELV